MERERDNIRRGLVNVWVSFYRDMGPGLPDEDARVLGEKIVELTECAGPDEDAFARAVEMACEWFVKEYLPQRLCIRGEEEPRRLSFP